MRSVTVVVWVERNARADQHGCTDGGVFNALFDGMVVRSYVSGAYTM